MFKLLKVATCLIFAAALLPKGAIGSMPGLNGDAPAAFAQFGNTSVETVAATSKAACKTHKNICNELSNTLDSGLEKGDELARDALAAIADKAASTLIAQWSGNGQSALKPVSIPSSNDAIAERIASLQPVGSL
jgi:hypothetical protein